MYAVALADGDIVAGHAARSAPASAPARSSTVASPSQPGGAARGSAFRTARAAACGRSTVARGAPVSARRPITPAAPAVTPTTHEQFVAAMDNKGALGQDDTQLLGHVSTVGAYWTGESNGAIAGVTRPDDGHALRHRPRHDRLRPRQRLLQRGAGGRGRVPGLLVRRGRPAGGLRAAVLRERLDRRGGHGRLELRQRRRARREGRHRDRGHLRARAGHNYGFEHANARYSGTSMEYYGVYDVMGFALSGVNQLTALSTPFRVFQGITDPGEIQRRRPRAGRRQPVHVTATISAAQRRHRPAQRGGDRPRHWGEPLPRLPLGHRVRTPAPSTPRTAAWGPATAPFTTRRA